ncbi:3-oxoacyl-ACP synthase III family protein [Micromonospora mangrovi]|uniref:3-oxoacyl-[acyl-carrier-protein] synthase III C-terminal domain-containing protein n=2 Tax=Micromonospora TaxID=1873 RepID=A0AAU7MBM0_9ACTN
MSFGIVAIGESLGEPVEVTDAVIAQYAASEETVRSWGYRRFHRAEDGALLTDLAVRACEEALRASSVDAAEVDLVVLAIADFAEYLCWDAAAAVQGRIGAVNAEAMLINQACSSGTVAFDAVAGRFATHPDYRHALIVSANRVCDTYQNRMDSTTTVLSDGAAAALVRRGHERGRWLATETITDGQYADFFRMDVGGAARPFDPSTVAGRDGLRVRNPLDRLGELCDNDARRMLAFVRKFGGNMRIAVDRACARTGTDISEIKRFIHLNDNQKAAADIARALGVPLAQLTNDLALENGHFGTADQLVGLRRLLRDGELQDGDLVALTTLGSGMHWAVTLLRV